MIGMEPSTREDFLIESIDLRPKGGQHVSTGPTGVKITHLPTGLYAYCDCQRSQHKNREVAMQMIEWGLLNL